MQGYATLHASLPLRSFVTADAPGGYPINTEFATAAVTAGQTVTGTARTISNPANGVLVNITGISDPYDVEVVYISAPGGDFSLQPVRAAGQTAWVASPNLRSWGGQTSYTVNVKFRNARPSVQVRSQEFSY